MQKEWSACPFWPLSLCEVIYLWSAKCLPWRSLASVDVSESDEIVARAEKLNDIGFKSKDALHISCAIDANCTVFLSTDKGIVNKASLVPELAILNPVDYDFTENDDWYRNPSEGHCSPFRHIGICGGWALHSSHFAWALRLHAMATVSLRRSFCRSHQLGSAKP